MLHVGSILPLSVQRVDFGANVADLVWVAHKRHLGNYGCGWKVQGSTAGRHRTDHAKDIAILAAARDELRRTIRRLVTSLQLVSDRLGEHGGASVGYCRKRTALHWN